MATHRVPPRPQYRQLLGPVNRARVAVYGTLALCSYISFTTYTAQNDLVDAARAQNPTRFTAALRHRDSLRDKYVCSRRNLRDGRYYTLVTAVWNHGGGLHLVGNMLGLWSFGRVLAYRFGAGPFLALFYGGGVLGNLLCLGLDGRVGDRDGDREGGMVKAGRKREGAGFIGASGGVCAVVAANACLNPWGTMIVGIMFVPVPVPNVVGALGFAGFSAWAQTSGLQANVAHLGHLGGLAYGLVYYLLRLRGLLVF